MARLLTMYCHLDTVAVKQGDVLAPGAALGTVGASGRVTGPTCMWSVSLNRAMVDPALFLDPADAAGRARGAGSMNPMTATIGAFQPFGA